MITYAHGTTGVADQCAPSRVQAGSEDQSETTYVYPELNDWLKVGYAILRTDYPGLGTAGPRPYLIGKSEARGVLDIVRAARQVESELGERYLIAGHSQGGQAALFAGRYAAGWIPELKPRGTVSYAPASHLTLQLETLPLLTTPSSLSAEAALTLFGAATANPGVVPTELLTSEANALYPEVDRKCLAELERPDSLGGLPPSELIAPGADTSTLRQVLDKNNPAVSIPEPIFLAQGGADTTVPPALTDLLDAELRVLGDDVTYRLYPGVGHTGIVAAAEPDALTFMEERLPPG